MREAPSGAIAEQRALIRQRVLAVAAAAAVVLTALIGATPAQAAPSCSTTTPNLGDKVTCDYSGGGTTTVQVPANTEFIFVEARGGAGGACVQYPMSQGGYTGATLDATGLSEVTVELGGMGAACSPGVTPGTGGGYAALYAGGLLNRSAALVVAGGGGGGGDNGSGGWGTHLSPMGSAGNTDSSRPVGLGGNQSPYNGDGGAGAGGGTAGDSWSSGGAGGAGAVCTGVGVGGDGGAGYGGGGGGGCSSSTGGGGGAGGAFVDGTRLVGNAAYYVGGWLNSPAAIEVTFSVAVPGVPTGVSATAGVDNASVSWTAGSGLQGSYTATAYDGSTAVGTCTVSAPATSCTISPLTAGTALTFSVTATNSGGTSSASTPSNPVTPLSPPMKEKTPDVKAPSAPGTPTATPVAGGVKVSWPKPSEDGTSPVIQYVVTASPGDAWCAVDAPARSCTVEHLSPDTSYAFTVVAYNGNAPSIASSTSASVVPLPGSGDSAGAGNGPGKPNAKPNGDSNGSDGTKSTGGSKGSGGGKNSSGPKGSSGTKGAGGTKGSTLPTTVRSDGASLFFAPFVTTLDRASKQALRTLAAGLGEHAHVEVVGMTQPRRTTARLQRSDARADAVAAYLKTLGVDSTVSSRVKAPAAGAIARHVEITFNATTPTTGTRRVHRVRGRRARFCV